MATRQCFFRAYFVPDSLDHLLALAGIDFALVYERVRRQGDLQPGDVLAQDRVLQRGTGGYHRRIQGR